MRLSISVLAKDTEERGEQRRPPQLQENQSGEVPRLGGWRLEPQDVGDPCTLSTNVSEFLIR